MSETETTIDVHEFQKALKDRLDALELNIIKGMRENASVISRASPSIGKLAVALAKAQGEMDDALKNTENQHLRTKYADLSSVRDAIRKPLSDNGIALIQRPALGEKAVTVQTLLVHGESDQWISTEFQMPVGQMSAHAVGTALTYARRYSILSMLGLASEDDDGIAAEQRPPLEGRPANAMAETTKKGKTRALADDPVVKETVKAVEVIKETKETKAAEPAPAPEPEKAPAPAPAPANVNKPDFFDEEISIAQANGMVEKLAKFTTQAQITEWLAATREIRPRLHPKDRDRAEAAYKAAVKRVKEEEEKARAAAQGDDDGLPF